MNLRPNSNMAPKLKPLFDPKTLLSKVGNPKAPADYKKDQKVFSQGDPAAAIFYLQKGRVKLTVVSKEGKEAVIAILGPGAFFGEACMAGQLRRMALAATMSECSIIRLEQVGVIRALHEDQAFSELFLHHLLARNIRIEEDLVDQLFN